MHSSLRRLNSFHYVTRLLPPRILTLLNVMWLNAMHNAARSLTREYSTKQRSGSTDNDRIIVQPQPHSPDRMLKELLCTCMRRSGWLERIGGQ